MKRLIIIFTIIISVEYIAGGQSNILKKLNFNEGEWKLYGISIRNEPNSLQDSLGDFFTNDIEVLKSLQKTWKLNEHKGFYGCGYHYNIIFIQNDTIEYNFSLNLNCKEICGNTGCFEFPESMLRQFYPNLKRIPKAYYEVSDLIIARKLYKHLLSVDTVLIASEGYQYWSKYPGVVKVEVIDSVINNIVKVSKFVFNKIITDYPNESFEIERGSSSHPPEGADTYDYYIYCSPTMGNNFKTFRIIKKWEAFDKQLIRVFGLTTEQITEIVKTIE